MKGIFKKLWLVRKGMFTNFLGIHFSQFGEDIILDELLKPEKDDGFYVDVGCYHPRKFSNTYMLYRRGWHGINIDMEEDKIRLFEFLRPRDTNILSAVSDKEETVTLYRYSKYSLESTIDENIAARVVHDEYDRKIVKTKTLTQILYNSPYREKQIDLLTIDIEGFDFRVLKSINFDVYMPKIIVIEDHHKNIIEILETATYLFLQSKGYVLRSWTFYSLIFVLPDSDIIRN